MTYNFNPLLNRWRVINTFPGVFRKCSIQIKIPTNIYSLFPIKLLHIHASIHNTAKLCRTPKRNECIQWFATKALSQSRWWTGVPKCEMSQAASQPVSLGSTSIPIDKIVGGLQKNPPSSTHTSISCMRLMLLSSSVRPIICLWVQLVL